MNFEIKFIERIVFKNVKIIIERLELPCGFFLRFSLHHDKYLCGEEFFVKFFLIVFVSLFLPISRDFEIKHIFKELKKEFPTKEKITYFWFKVKSETLLHNRIHLYKYSSLIWYYIKVFKASKNIVDKIVLISSSIFKWEKPAILQSEFSYNRSIWIIFPYKSLVWQYLKLIKWRIKLTLKVGICFSIWTIRVIKLSSRIIQSQGHLLLLHGLSQIIQKIPKYLYSAIKGMIYLHQKSFLHTKAIF